MSKNSFKHQPPGLRIALAFAVALLLASVFFIANPLIDLRVSGAFYNAEGGFTAGRSGWAVFAGDVVRPTVKALTALAILAGLVLYFARLRLIADFRRRYLLFFASVTLAPGLIVDGILKGFSGRARPVHVEQFGGDKQFSPAWEFTDQCASNCSFVSGDVSGTAVLIALIVFVPARFQPPFAALIAVLTAMAAYYRLAVGKHFFSDVTLSALITGLIVALCYWAIFERPGHQPTAAGRGAAGEN